MGETCPGFRFAGVAAGIKKSARPDLGLVVADGDVPTAGVFTRNLMRAAPVLVSERRVGLCRGIFINSGNANACTGEQGLVDARVMTELAARAVGCADERMLVASTGVIGHALPMDKIAAHVPSVASALRADGLDDFVQAIMTTDRFEKRALRRLGGARLVGVAKGAGMIAPNMATTLGFVFTDVAVTPAFLQTALRETIEDTFNRISVDGDTSTNDSVFVMASGAAKNAPIDGGPAGVDFQKALFDVLDDLSRQIVRDGEGATHVVTIEVAGAPSAVAAEQVARRIGSSPLFKAAMFGADPNWGRILCAIGNAGVAVDPTKVDIAVGDVQIVAAGKGTGREDAAHAVMRQADYAIHVDLHGGDGRGHHTTCDLTVDYVRLNADYST